MTTLLFVDLFELYFQRGTRLTPPASRSCGCLAWMTATTTSCWTRWRTRGCPRSQCARSCARACRRRSARAAALRRRAGRSARSMRLGLRAPSLHSASWRRCRAVKAPIMPSRAWENAD